MPIIYTLSGRTTFSYRGNVPSGVVLEMQSEYEISSVLFSAVINSFSGSSVPLGANMTDPIRGGLGEWTAINSKNINKISLTPKHASFLAAILVHEGFATSTKDGNRIMLVFPTVAGKVIAT